MSIREDLVASAAKFLQDPSVASSPIESRISFLQAKNLTKEEVSAALARAGSEFGSVPAQSYATPSPPPPLPPTQAYSGAAPKPSYYGQYAPQYPPPGWQSTPPARDWRDWFIMATVVGGVSYGLYTLGKRYVYPLIAPPTPERLEQDKKSIDEQFEKTFALVEQLAKDTEALKAAEQERTQRLDGALSELESVMAELKSANRRREDDAQRVRDDMQNLKDSIPRAMTAQKDLTDNRMRELNAELKSLKTLMTQRMNSTGAGPVAAAAAGGYARPLGAPSQPASAPGPVPAAEGSGSGPAAPSGSADTLPPIYSSSSSNVPRSSPFGTGAPGKASIPAWQLAMASKSSGSGSGLGSGSGSGTASSTGATGDGGGSNAAQEAAGSS